MKKLFLLAILGMSTLAYSQAYTYLPYGGTAYAVPDLAFDDITELNSNTSGQKFTKFDRTGETSTPEADMDKTFGRNAASTFTTTDKAGTDADRGWVTNTDATLPSPGYYTCIRTHASGGPRSWGAWLMYTVNFTETGVFNPMLRVRDGAANRNQSYDISIYSPTDLNTPLYTKSCNFTGATNVGTSSTDGTAKLMAIINGGTTSNCIWFKVLDGFTVPTSGNYIVKISGTSSAGAGGLGGYTFWKQAAVVAPEVVLNSPSNGNVFEAGSPITLSAKATAGDGTLAGVEFFNGETSLGQGVAAGGGVYTLTINATGQLYDFKAIVTETGGADPSTATSIGDVKVIGIAEPFNGTTYPGTPWNGTAWSFGTNNTANYVMGNTITRANAADFYNGIPVWAFDLGSVNREMEKSPTSLRYVAGGSTANATVTGTDIRAAKALELSKTLSASDEFSRNLLVPGASRFLSTADFRASSGGAWGRYTCNFAPGQYKLIVRASGDICSGNYSVYARFLKPDGTVIGQSDTNTGIYTWNAGQPLVDCAAKLNVTKMDPVANPAYSVFVAPTASTHWVVVDHVIELSGNVIVEISDPDPVLGGNVPGNGAFGEFTFEYVGATAVKNLLDNNFKAFTANKTLTVEYLNTEMAQVSVYNLSGNLIISKPMLNGKMISELPGAGVYFVRLHTKGNTLVKRVIVK